MNTSRSLRNVIVRGAFTAALLATPAFAISSQEIAILRAKAEKGNAVAQYNLGMVYAATNDPTSDPIEAYVWLNLAADNGATGRALTDLETQLTPAQLAEGKTRLEARRAELGIKKHASAPTESVVVSAAPANDSSSPISSGSSTNVTPASPIAAPAPVTAPGSAGNDAASLQNALSKMSAELSSAWKENDQLKATIAKLNQAPKENAEADAANAKLKSAEDELAQAKESAAHLNDQVRSLTEENQQLHAKTADAASAAATEKSLADAQASIKELQSQLSDAQSKLAANAEAATQASGAQTKLDAALRSYELQQKQVDELQKSLASTQADHNALTQQVAELTSASVRSQGDAQTKLKAAQEEVVQLTQQNQLLNKQISDAKSNGPSSAVATLTAQLNDTRERLTAAERALTASREDLDRATKEHAQQSSQELTDARAQLQTAESRAKAAEDAATKAAQESESLKQQLASAQDAEQKASAAETASAKAAQEIESLKQELAAAKASASKSTEADELKSQLAAAQQALASANADRASLSERLTAAEAKANATPAKSNEAEELRTQLAAAQQELAAAKAAAAQPAAAPTPAAPTEDVAALHKQLDETQGKLDAALRTYQLQQEEQERLQKALANIDGERASLADRLQTANTQASQATAQAAVNQDATVQLAATREQLRQVQNEVARLATENSQLRIRTALPPAQNNGTYAFASAPKRPASGPNPAGSLNAFGSTTGNGAATSPSRPNSVASAAPSPTPTPATRSYTIVDGDTLTRIARKMYGSSERWPQILEANHDVIHDVNNLTVGAKLRIP